MKRIGDKKEVPKFTLLIVEDHESLLKFLIEWLGMTFADCLILEARNGEEALEKINATPPHLIFVDIRLPGVNGFQLTQKIRKDFPNIRIVLLSGNHSPEYQQAASQYGADAFLVKESIEWDVIEDLVKSIR